jgi:hypothetical protein
MQPIGTFFEKVSIAGSAYYFEEKEVKNRD